MLKWPKDCEFNEIAFKFIVHFYILNRKICLWHLKFGELFSVLQFSFLCQSLLHLDSLLTHLRQESQISDSIDSALPSDHSSFVVVHQNIFIAKKWLPCDDRFAHLPNMTFGPCHMALESFPRSQLRDGSEDAYTLSRDGLMEDLEVQIIKLSVWIE